MGSSPPRVGEEDSFTIESNQMQSALQGELNRMRKEVERLRQENY